MLVIHISFALRKRIGSKNWRRLHWATYGVFAGATAHGVAAGTDTSRPWVIAIYAGAVFAVVAGTAVRALTPPLPVKRKPRPAAATDGAGGAAPAPKSTPAPRPVPEMSGDPA
jgi:DMSO/TMAO reductase YedYZ heme-binding membrane subunit